MCTQRSAGLASAVNLRNLLHAGDETCKQGIHPGFETQGRPHQKSKTGFISPRRTNVLQKKKLTNFKDYDLEIVGNQNITVR